MARLVAWSRASYHETRLLLPTRLCLYNSGSYGRPSLENSPWLAAGRPICYRPLLVTPLAARPLHRRALSSRAQGKPDSSQPTSPESTQDAALQACLWVVACAYVFWLFILPFAPGDPAWAINLDTIRMLLDLSVNFFFILPLTNWLGIHFLESPSVHPTAEALFNLVMGWTVMFAPLLFTDKRRNRFGGSLVILWAIQMLLTNTVLAPYMAIRLNKQSNQQEAVSSESGPIKLDLSGVESVMMSGAKVVGVVCGAVGLTSALWFLLGRANEGFGGFSDRWTFFLEYLSSNRVGYAFVWDICLYSVFQPWLIGGNLSNVDKSKVDVVSFLRYVPYVGLVAYLWGLANFESSET